MIGTTGGAIYNGAIAILIFEWRRKRLPRARVYPPVPPTVIRSIRKVG